MSDADKLIQTATVPQLVQAIRNGETNASDLVNSCLARIEKHNDALRAIISISPIANDEATKLDTRISQGEQLPPLAGIPILIKDNIETRELPTTAGSLALQHNHTERDAPIIAALRQAGAIIIGKTNLSEWANIRSAHSSSGWSAIGGQCRNAYDVSRSPCGSSAGSAVAVASRMAPLAIGTETDGSIVSPASANGVVGFKPTMALLSQVGIVPISHSQDTAGPMAVDVASAALMFDVLHGDSELTDFQDADLVGKRIGVVRSAAGFHPEVDAVFNNAVSLFKGQGADIVDGLQLKPESRGFGRAEFTRLLIELKHDLNAYLADLPNDLNQLDLAAIIAFNQQHQPQEMPLFGQDTFIIAEASDGLQSDAYRQASDLLDREAAGALDGLLQGQELDVLIAPTSGVPGPIDQINGEHVPGGISTLPAVAGYPHLTLPMGWVRHMPVGLSIIARADTDREVFRIGYEFERTLQAQPAYCAFIPNL